MCHFRRGAAILMMDRSGKRVVMKAASRKPTAACLCFLAAGASASARAELPLTIEGLLVREHRMTATFASSLASHREPLLLAADGAATLAWREVRIEQTALGLRYGLTDRLELNARYEHSRLHWDLDGQIGGTAQGERWVLGANWLATRGVAGSVLVDARLDALAKPIGARGGWQRGAGVSLGATWYRSLDPVVLSLSGRYCREAPAAGYTDGDRPGDHFTTNATVNFAVNDRVTLLGGVAMRRQAPDRIADRTLGGSRLRTTVEIGAAISPWSRGTLFLRGGLPLGAANTGGALSLEWLQTF